MAVMFLPLQILLLGIHVVQVLSTMYLDTDLELLLSSPARPSVIVVSRLVEMLVFPDLALFLVLTVGFWGLGWQMGMALLYYPLVLLGGLLLPLLPLSLAVLIAMVMARYMPAWRVREMLVVIGGFLWLSYTVGQAYLFRSLQENAWLAFVSLLLRIQRVGFFAIAPGPIPGNWIAWAAVATGLGRWDLALFPFLGFLFVSLGVFGLTAFAAARLYLSGWSNMGVVQRRRRRQALALGRPTRWELRRMWAVIRKDWLLIRRDPRQLIYLLWPIAYLIGVLSPLRDGFAWNWAVITGIDLLWLAVLLTLSFLLLGVTNVLGLNVFSKEGKSAWVLFSAPISPWELVMAKFWSRYLPSVIVALVISAGLAYGLRIGWVGFAQTLGAALLLTTGLVALAVGMDAASPEFSEEIARGTRQTSEGCITLLLLVGYVLAVDIGLLLPTVRAVAYSLNGMGKQVTTLVVVPLLVGATALMVRWSLHQAVERIAQQELTGEP